MGPGRGGRGGLAAADAGRRAGRSGQAAGQVSHNTAVQNCTLDLCCRLGEGGAALGLGQDKAAAALQTRLVSLLARLQEADTGLWLEAAEPREVAGRVCGVAGEMRELAAGLESVAAELGSTLGKLFPPLLSMVETLMRLGGQQAADKLAGGVGNLLGRLLLTLLDRRGERRDSPGPVLLLGRLLSISQQLCDDLTAEGEAGGGTEFWQFELTRLQERIFMIGWRVLKIFILNVTVGFGDGRADTTGPSRLPGRPCSCSQGTVIIIKLLMDVCFGYFKFWPT